MQGKKDFLWVKIWPSQFEIKLNIRKNSSLDEGDLWWPSLMANMGLPLTAKNQIPLSLDQSLTWICCWPSSMSAVAKNHKNGYQDGWKHVSLLKIATRGPLNPNYNLEFSTLKDIRFNLISCEFNLNQWVTDISFSFYIFRQFDHFCLSWN